MKKVLLAMALIAVSSSSYAQYINEVHYDNDGGDTGEFIEVFLPTGADPADFTVTLYNGSNGSIYGTHGLSTFTAGDMDAMGTYYTKFISGIQNGAPDGMALDENGTLIEFLSYEGTFTPSSGPAAGVTSTDIVVEETSSTPVGESLQRGDDGTWFGPADNTAGSPNELPLPITLTSFSAKPMNSQAVDLNWSTSSELNNEYFSIEHSTNGRDFVEVDQVVGALNSSIERNYSYIHKDAQNGVNYYRLRQVDTDGTFSFSPIEVVRLSDKMEVDVFPTLAHTSVTLQSTEALDNEAVIEVYNILGRLINTDVLEAGATQKVLNVTNLQKGHYLVRISNGVETHTARFIKK